MFVSFFFEFLQLQRSDYQDCWFFFRTNQDFPLLKVSEFFFFFVCRFPRRLFYLKLEPPLFCWCSKQRPYCRRYSKKGTVLYRTKFCVVSFSSLLSCTYFLVPTFSSLLSRPYFLVPTFVFVLSGPYFCVHTFLSLYFVDIDLIFMCLLSCSYTFKSFFSVTYVRVVTFLSLKCVCKHMLVTEKS